MISQNKVIFLGVCYDREPRATSFNSLFSIMTGAQHQQSISSTPKAIIDRATYLPMSYLLVTLKPTTYGLKSHSMILHSLD